MNKLSDRKESIAHRAELLAELFLQDLGPEFVAQPTHDFGYDFFAGFQNPRGGTNIVAIEVKSTEMMKNNFVDIRTSKYKNWANSNIPVLLLVVDVKENEYYFAWPDPEVLNRHQDSQVVRIHLAKIDDKSKGELRDRLAA
jgi:hypothetical protein